MECEEDDIFVFKTQMNLGNNENGKVEFGT
jgi:hypothetical protein